MRTKLSALLVRKNNHTTTKTAIIDDDSSNISAYKINTTKKKKKKKKKISRISQFILPENIRSIIRNVLTSNKLTSFSNDDCSEEVEVEENTNVSSPENMVKRDNFFLPADKQPATEALPGFLINKLKRATSDKLARVRSFRSNSFRRARSSTPKEMEVKKIEVGGELCKKRILMGVKCRPLNVSGALHYDDNGILLPEEILSPRH